MIRGLWVVGRSSFGPRGFCSCVDQDESNVFGLWQCVYRARLTYVPSRYLFTSSSHSTINIYIFSTLPIDFFSFQLPISLFFSPIVFTFRVSIYICVTYRSPSPLYLRSMSIRVCQYTYFILFSAQKVFL